MTVGNLGPALFSSSILPLRSAVLPPTTLWSPQHKPDTFRPWIYFSSFLTAPCSNSSLFSQGFNHTPAAIQQVSAVMFQVKDLLEGFYLYKVLQKLRASLLPAFSISADK